MNSKKMFFVMSGLVGLLSIVLVGVVFLGDSVVKKQADKLTELKLEYKLLSEQQTILTQAEKDIVQYEELEQIAKSVVPQDKDQARAVRQIVSLASEVGIIIDTITFPTSNLGTTTTKTETASTTPAVSPITQATPVAGVAGVYALEMVISPKSDQKITYYQMLDFLEKLETNRRTAQVTGVRVTPTSSNATNPYVTFTLTINIFLKP